jgi:hypothetical protein
MKRVNAGRRGSHQRAVFADSIDCRSEKRQEFCGIWEKFTHDFKRRYSVIMRGSLRAAMS